jgi:hypothetical protein
MICKAGRRGEHRISNIEQGMQNDEGRDFGIVLLGAAPGELPFGA